MHRSLLLETISPAKPPVNGNAFSARVAAESSLHYGLSLLTWPVVLSLLGLLASTTAHAQAPVRLNRPIGVPDAYVITSSGYFHPSCVRQLAQEDTFLEDGPAIQHADGTVESLPACEYPHYAATGGIAIEVPVALAAPHSTWVEDIRTTTSKSYGALTAIWTVPLLAPTSNDNQVFGFFPGFQDKSGVYSILQPVLSWNNHFLAAWDIHSEDCCPGGYDIHSQPMRVNSGDTIKGFIRQTCAAGTLMCPTWKVTTMDVTPSPPISTPLSTKRYGATFDEAFAAVLEAPANLIQCSDYPPDGQITFSGVALYDYNLKQISNPNWLFVNDDSVAAPPAPQCGYTAPNQTQADEVTLYYLPTVNLNPFGTVQVSSTPPPYTTVLVDGRLNSLAAPTDVTVTLFRQVISQCSGILFRRNDTVVISEGQTTGSFSDYAARDPKCPTLPITTQWTITGAVLAPTNLPLNLGVVPPEQLTLSAVF